jgi:hypothetical protein
MKASYAIHNLCRAVPSFTPTKAQIGIGRRTSAFTTIEFSPRIRHTQAKRYHLTKPNAPGAIALPGKHESPNNSKNTGAAETGFLQLTLKKRDF